MQPPDIFRVPTKGVSDFAMNYRRFQSLAVLFVLELLGVQRAQAEPPPMELTKLHTAEALAYQIFADEEHTQPIRLKTQPVLSWTNLVGEHTQYGNVFVWVSGGRPAAIGTIFSTRAGTGQRMLVHEFHTLSTSRLFPVTPQSSRYQWKPARGIELLPADSAPPVAESRPRRRRQMREIARSFSATSRGPHETWELRLLPTPLFEYEPSSGEALEGAIFSMVSSAGTDPEVLLLIEARRPAGSATWAWHAAALRFSDKDLIVRRADKTFWSSLDDEQRHAKINSDYTLIETADKTYMCYRARTIDELPDAAP